MLENKSKIAGRSSQNIESEQYETKEYKDNNKHRSGFTRGLNSELKKELFGKKDRKEFVLKRIFDAPIDMVFQAWTSPKHLEHWFAPKDFIMPLCKMDVRSGGSYQIIMRSKEGIDYPLNGVYYEVLRPKLLVLTENWEDHPDNWLRYLQKNHKDKSSKDTLNTVRLEEYKGKTLLTLKTIFRSSEMRDSMLRTGLGEGWSQSLDRLAECLEKFELSEISDF